MEISLAQERAYMPQAKSTEWNTPRSLFLDWNGMVGPFTLDPCATAENALCENYITKEQDGLKADWGGHKVFLNPPYGKGLEKWVEKSFIEAQKPNTLVVALLPARVDTRWFHKYILGKSEIHFLKGRLKFSGATNSAPFPSMVVVWGNTLDLMLSRCQVKSPLRYPGGKSKAIKKILPLIPMNFHEFREPFVGGGSVFLSVKQVFGDAPFIVGDLNKDLTDFWSALKEYPIKLCKTLRDIRYSCTDGRALFDEYRDKISNDMFESAVRFFILNRITFSGLAESGGYSEESFMKRFTLSSIDRLLPASALLQGVDIVNDDYEYLLNKPGENVFIFMDPPYMSSTKSRLYGKKGDLHTSFDHERLAAAAKKCKHQWLLTYDDSKEVRELFDFAYIHEWNLTYGMDNYKQKKTKRGKELFISNYSLTERIC